MPLTAVGNTVMKYLKKKHGAKKGSSIFYASINKGIAGSDKWHKIEGKKGKVHKNRFSESLMS